MTPRQLKYFQEIARSGSITAAASKLHIAQPALSHHIGAMEEEIGTPLLLRHARGVELTPEGQRLLERATAILRQLDRLTDDVRGAGQGAAGTVSLFVVGSVATSLAVPLLRRLEQRAPGVRLQLSTGMSREARALVEARRVDLALLPVATELSRLEVLPLFQESFALFGVKKRLGRRSGPVRMADLGDLALVAPDRDHDLRKMIERVALAHGCSLNVRYEVNNPELYRQIVQEGLACAIMPRNAFPSAPTLGLGVRDIVEPGLERVQSLAWMVDHPLSGAGELVRDTLKELVMDMIDKGSLMARPLL